MKQPKLKLIYNMINELKKEKKIITDMYKDALANDKEYPTIIEDLKTQQAKKKLIESKIMDEMESDFNRVDDLKSKIEKKQSELSDIVVKTLINNQDPNINDRFGNEMEPIVKVTYKKI